MNDEQLVRLAARMGDLVEQVRILAKEVYDNTKRTEELRERIKKMEDHLQKIEDVIDWEAARTTMRGVPDVPKPRGTFTVERLEELREANKLEERGVFKIGDPAEPKIENLESRLANAPFSLDDSDFHETPKQRWLRENLRPGEVYAGILLGMDGKPDMHIMVQRHWSNGYSAPTLRETRLIEVNTWHPKPFSSSTFVRRIPVQ